ncbi:MAG TPA: RDD family protein [Oligoflexus sp.]|uniref:RDD family protein n=1 Tax=Oligoflexus sp. TaxID=1971216 RepID=UPI002D7FA69E|nr:RDD family protein [Oligoflexus sp.]HET9239296.1 RDD family protein [Oligoflexus sp.]
MLSRTTVSLDHATSSERFKSAAVDITVFVTIFLISIPLVNQLLARFDHAEFTVLWMLFFFLGYENIPVCLWGQSLGQKICGLKVVDAQGRKPGVLPILHRWCLKIMFGTRSYRPASNGDSVSEAHDKATGVYVVRARTS